MQAHVFAINLVNFLALKMIQHLLPIRLIKNLDTCSFCAINLVNFLAIKLLRHELATGSIKNLDKGTYFCHKNGEFSST